MQLWAIAANTYRENIRDRVLYSIVFFAVLVLCASLVMEEITIGDQDKVVRSVALGAIRAFGSVMSIFLGIGLVYKEIEKKTVYTIVSKPIARWVFIVGKYLGLMGVIVTMIALMAGLYILLMLTQHGPPATSVYASWWMLTVELGLLTAWAILFSSYSAPITAASFSIAVFVIGHLADDIWRFGLQAESEQVRQFAGVLYWFLPNLSVFNVHDLAVHHLPIPVEQLIGATGYGLGYTVVVLTLAVWVFSGRDFK